MTASELAGFLENHRAGTAALPVCVGFDAFVDEIFHVVSTRHSPEGYEPISGMNEFADWAARSAGRSGLREAVLLERAAGGCAVNLGDGVAALGFPVRALAALGTPPDPAFSDFINRCESVDALGQDPGRTTVLEFTDGKLMLCSFAHFAGFNPGTLRDSGAQDILVNRIRGARAMVMTSWSVFPRMTDCWRWIQSDILPAAGCPPLLFFDLADPASRSRDEIRGMLDVLPGFQKLGNTVLSLNGNEAHCLARCLDMDTDCDQPEDYLRLAAAMREKLGIFELGIHLIRFAVSDGEQGGAIVAGPHCASPKRSVGAGDRFNAGWLAGHMLGLPPEDRLRLATAVSGFFVRAARSGSLPEIAGFLRDWEAANLDTTAPTHS